MTAWQPQHWWQMIRARKALALALVVSLCLHLLFVAQKDWGSLFDEMTSTSAIEARLIPNTPPAPKAPISDAQNKPKPTTQKNEVKPEKLKQEPIQENDSAPVANAETVPVPNVDEPAPSEPNVVADEPPSAIEDSGDEALAGSPYQQVVTEFAIYLNGESEHSGRSVITFINENNERYSLQWTVEATGLLGLFYPNLIQTSEGKITPQGLQPSHYQYQFGDKKDKSYQAEFDWENRTLKLKSSKGDKATDMAPNAQDMLSFMYQFMYAAPLNEMRINLTNGKRIAAYDYVFEGEDSVTVQGQALKALHIAHSKADNEEKTELWLAVDYRYIPIKIKKTDKKGMVIEQVATQIFTQLITEAPLP